MSTNVSEIALEELSLLQAFIARQEELRFKVRGLTTALATGLALARASTSVEVDRTGFLVVGIGVITIGWTLEAWHNMAEHAGIRRSHCVEEFLRGERSYDGPRIGESVGSPDGASDVLVSFLKSLRYGRVLFFHVLLVVLLVLVAWTSPIVDDSALGGLSDVQRLMLSA